MLHGLLAGLGLLTGAAAVVGLLRAVHVDPAAAHRIRIDGHALSYPAMNVASGLLLLVALVGAVSLMRIVRHGWRIWREHLRFAAYLREVTVETRAIQVDSGSVAIHVFAHAGAEAFCVGFLRPEIYVSTAARELLDERELMAVVAHEHQHQRSRDPLRVLVARLLARGLFFLPVLHRLLRRGELFAELDADSRAVQMCGWDKGALASAMLTLGRNEDEVIVGIGRDRVDHLLGEFVRPRLPRALIAVAIMTLMAMIVVLWQAWHTASISATFGLPLISRQPCVLALALIPATLVLAELAAQTARSRRAR